MLSEHYYVLLKSETLSSIYRLYSEKMNVCMNGWVNGEIDIQNILLTIKIFITYPLSWNS